MDGDKIERLRADLAAAHEAVSLCKQSCAVMDECEARGDVIRALQADLAAERERLEKFRKLDAEAATYCESVICMRTHFTGNPPYVGWKGLGLAMGEAFDERDAALAALRVAREALSWALFVAIDECVPETMAQDYQQAVSDFAQIDAVLAPTASPDDR